MAKILEKVNYEGMEEIFYPAYYVEGMYPSFAILMAKAFIYGRVDSISAKAICMEIEDHKKCFDPDWLVQTNPVMFRIVGSQLLSLNPCPWPAFDVTLPGGEGYDWDNFLFHVDLHIDRAVDSMMRRKIKMRENLDYCAETTAILENIRADLVRKKYTYII